MTIAIVEDRGWGEAWPILCHTREEVTKALTEFAIDHWDERTNKIPVPDSPALIVESFYGDESGYFVTVCDDVDFWRPTRLEKAKPGSQESGFRLLVHTELLPNASESLVHKRSRPA